MLRRTAKISVRLGVLVVIALVIKAVLDSQKKTPAPVVPVRPPTPKPDVRIPDPEPAAATVAEATAVEPELQPEPEPEPEPQPEPAPEPEPESPTEEPVAEAPSAPRTQPLKAKKAAKKTTKAAAKNRKAPQNVTPDTPVGAILSWVEPVGGVCPPSHPIKAKLGSRVFRRPGMASYENSKPDRCYASEGAARRGGFNEAQR